MSDNGKPSENKNLKYKAGVFLATVSGISAVIGFSTAIASAKRSDPKYFDKGLTELTETGPSLALRALKWGTIYSFTGCGLFFYGIWKLSGAESVQDFRYKMGSILPRIPKNDPPVGRTEFSGLNDLLEYLQTLKSDKDK